MSAIWIGANHGLLKCDYRSVNRFRSKCVLVFDGRRGESPGQCFSRAKGQGWTGRTINGQFQHICPEHSPKVKESKKKDDVPLNLDNVAYIDETRSWREKNGPTKSN